MAWPNKAKERRQSLMGGVQFDLDDYLDSATFFDQPGGGGRNLRPEGPFLPAQGEAGEALGTMHRSEVRPERAIRHHPGTGKSEWPLQGQPLGASPNPRPLAWADR